MNNTIEIAKEDKEIQRVLNKLFDKTPDIKPLIQSFGLKSPDLSEQE